jgi:hypothetical protein
MGLSLVDDDRPCSCDTLFEGSDCSAAAKFGSIAKAEIAATARKMEVRMADVPLRISRKELRNGE